MSTETKNKITAEEEIALDDMARSITSKGTTYIVFSSQGYWGKGASVMDAVNSVLKEGAGKRDRAMLKIIVGVSPENVTVNNYGTICYPVGGISPDGITIKQLGALL